jgi:hypothetical protein
MLFDNAGVKPATAVVMPAQGDVVMPAQGDVHLL